MFARLCELMTPVLAGPARAEIVAAAAAEPRMPDALVSLGYGVAGHAFQTSRGAVRFAKVIERFDAECRAEGLHALHDWDGVSPHPHADTVPIDVLNYIADLRRNDATDHRVLAILLDYYFLHVLSLMALRAWDDGDADTNIELLGLLLAALQGPHGSGQRFVEDPETLWLFASSRFERDGRGFARLLERVQSLGQPHQLRVALGHAGALSCHLRFGREATYAGDLAALRADNATDYPWLRFAVLTLLEALDRDASAPECTHYLEALVGALSADPEWLMADHEVAARVAAHRDALRRATETFRPGDAGYSPLALFYNFSHNIVKGAVVDAMLWGDPWNVTLNDLFTSDGALSHHASPLGRRQKLAVTLMDYARKNPHRIDGRPVPVIVYDPASGRRLLDGLRRAI